MKASLLTSLFTILLQIFVIFIYYLHKERIFRTIAEFLKLQSPSSSRNPFQKIELHSSSATSRQTILSSDSKKKNDPFLIGATRVNGQKLPPLCSLFNRCELLSLEDPSKNLTEVFRHYRKNHLPLAFSLLDRNHSWKAFDWNLWDFTRFRWPFLHDVLEVDRSVHTIATTSPIGVFLPAQKNFAPTSLDGFTTVAQHPSEESNPLSISETFIPDLPFDAIGFQPYTVQTEMLLWDFLNDLFPNVTTVDRCRYYSTNYRVFESLTQVEADTEWKRLQFYEQLPEISLTTIQSIAPIFHLLYPQCGLQFRTSEYHQVKVQLQGTTDYLLIPPNTLYQDFFPYPYHHPFHPHSQANIHSIRRVKGSSYRVELIRNMIQQIPSISTITLTKGQALIIPPGFFVYTEAQTFSMSMDILSPSREQYQLLEILSLPIPCLLPRQQILRNDSSPNNSETESQYLLRDEKIVCTQIYLVHVLSRMMNLTTIQEYRQRYYTHRYELVYGRNTREVLEFSYEEEQEIVQRMGNSINEPQNPLFQCYRNHPVFIQSFLDQLDQDRMKRMANKVAKQLNQLQSTSSSMTSSSWFWIDNYIDSILRKVYEHEKFEKILLFIQECFNLAGKIEVIEEEEGPPILKMN